MPELQPWERLAELLEGEQAPQPETLERFLDELPDPDVVLSVSRLEPGLRARLLTSLDADDAADLLDLLPGSQAVAVVSDLEPAQAARIVEELPSNEQADLLGDLEEPHADAILAHMDAQTAREARALRTYDDDVAGGLMVTEFLAYRARRTVGDVVADLRHNAEHYKDYDVQYIYVTTRWRRLRGVLRMRDLLLASENTAVGDVMIPDPDAVSDTSSLEELRRLFERNAYRGVPVVDAGRHLLGVVWRRAVGEAATERSERDFQRAQGVVSGEELRSMPLLTRTRRRLGWLSLNIVLNVLAATVIAANMDTLAAVIALAVFLPIISDMSGCSGNQAVAVTMRELSLGVVLPTEMLRVWSKEALVGVINGLLLGILIAGVAWFWKGNPWLGLVVGAAMALNTVVAVSIGGTVPLLLRRMGADPALASGPILTTVTDMCGFFLVMSLAALWLPRLIG